MLELFHKPSQINYFKKAEKNEDVNWNGLFMDYGSVVDYPAARYYKQISAKFPDAKIIHTHRDPEEWYASAMETIFWVNRMPLSMIIEFGLYFPFRSETRKRLPLVHMVGAAVRKRIWKNL